MFTWTWGRPLPGFDSDSIGLPSLGVWQQNRVALLFREVCCLPVSLTFNWCFPKTPVLTGVTILTVSGGDQSRKLVAGFPLTCHLDDDFDSKLILLLPTPQAFAAFSWGADPRGHPAGERAWLLAAGGPWP